MNEPTSPSEWTVHVLNIHGVFFERWVEHVARMAPEPWKLRATQFAVEFPPPDGPARGREGCLDVWAEHRLGTTWRSLLIECKKHNPNFVDWVFFGRQNDELAQPVTVTALDIVEDTSGGAGVRVVKRTPSHTVPICDEARETRGTWEAQTTRQASKTSNKAIGDASHQIALATQALINEQWGLVRDWIRDGRLSELDWRWHNFVPVIATTANLKVVQFDPTKVNPETGEIAWSDVSLRDVDWLWYLYPLPRHLQFGTYEELTLYHSDSVHFLSKLPIAVVRGAYLREFMKELSSESLPPRAEIRQE